MAVRIQRPDVWQTIVDHLETLGEVAQWFDKHSPAGRAYGFTQTRTELRRA